MLHVALIIALALTQQLSVSIKPATAFQVAWDHDGQDASFRWWCDGAILKNFSAAEIVKAPVANPDGTFTHTATVPGLPLGSHQCFISAFNAIGEAKSEPLTLPIGTVPSVPVRLRIVVIINPGGAS